MGLLFILGAAPGSSAFAAGASVHCKKTRKPAAICIQVMTKPLSTRATRLHVGERSDDIDEYGDETFYYNQRLNRSPLAQPSQLNPADIELIVQAVMQQQVQSTKPIDANRGFLSKSLLLLQMLLSLVVVGAAGWAIWRLTSGKPLPTALLLQVIAPRKEHLLVFFRLMLIVAWAAFAIRFTGLRASIQKLTGVNVLSFRDQDRNLDVNGSSVSGASFSSTREVLAKPNGVSGGSHLPNKPSLPKPVVSHARPSDVTVRQYLEGQIPLPSIPQFKDSSKPPVSLSKQEKELQYLYEQTQLAASRMENIRSELEARIKSYEQMVEVEIRKQREMEKKLMESEKARDILINEANDLRRQIDEVITSSGAGKNAEQGTELILQQLQTQVEDTRRLLDLEQRRTAFLGQELEALKNEENKEAESSSSYVTSMKQRLDALTRENQVKEQEIHILTMKRLELTSRLDQLHDIIRLAGLNIEGSDIGQDPVEMPPQSGSLATDLSNLPESMLPSTNITVADDATDDAGGNEREDSDEMFPSGTLEPWEYPGSTPVQSSQVQQILSKSKSLIERAKRRGKGFRAKENSRFFEEAVVLLEKGSDLAPQDPGILFECGSTLIAWAKNDLGDPSAEQRLITAEARFQKALVLDPGNQGCLFSWGLSLCLQANMAGTRGQIDKSCALFDRAADIYESIIQQDPASRLSYFNLGLALYSKAKLLEPSMATRSDARDTVSQDTISCYSNAAKALKKCLRLDPKDSKALQYLELCEASLLNFGYAI